MKRVLKRYYKPILVLALLGLIGAVLCGCMPDEDCEHEFVLLESQAYVMNSPETEIPKVGVLPIVSCGERGYWYDKYSCAKCSGIIYRRASDELVIQQHDMSPWMSLVKPACTQAGTEKRYCRRDCCFINGDDINSNKMYETRTVPALGHNYKKIDAVPATCTEAGRTGGKKCTRCGHVSGLETIPALGHDWGEPIYTWKNDHATCDAIRVCNRDASHVEGAKATVLARSTGDICTEGRSIVYTATFPRDTAFTTQTFTEQQPAGHTPQVIPAVTATCAETGLTEGQKCSVCGEILVAQKTIPIDPDNHVGALTLVPGRAATCVSEGAKDGFYCSACKATVQETIPIDPNNHLMAKVVEGTAATCTEAGLSSYTVCADCGVVVTAQKELPALGHTGGKATCTEAAVCTRCGESYGELGEHVMVEVEPAVEPSCESPGMTAYYRCSVCEEYEIPSEPYGEALGHTGGTATCKEQAVCTRCGEPYGELDAHSYASTGESWEGEETVDEKRYATWGHFEECSVCEDVRKVEDGRKEIQEELGPTG